jgi:hypothetical protein
MKNVWKSKLLQASSFLLCLILALKNTSGLGPSEFSGGRLTGPLLSMSNDGTLLLLLALLLTFVYPRIAAAIGIVASLLCLPLYIYFSGPVPFAHIFYPEGQFSVPQAPGIQWHEWVAIALLASAVSVSLCLHTLISSRRRACGPNLAHN